MSGGSNKDEEELCGVIDVLLKAGADVTAKDWLWKQPADYAREKGYHLIATYLENYERQLVERVRYKGAKARPFCSGAVLD